MIGSSEVNKVIRKMLSPVLKENGFSKIKVRQSWGRHKDCIWVFEIRAVGKYFSDVTGWTPSSLTVELGIYYDFFPVSAQIKREGDLMTPKPWQCQFYTSLIHTDDQLRYIPHISNPAERRRRDIWWIEPDGSNIEIAVSSIKEAYLSKGLEWYKYFSDKGNAYTQVLLERNYWGKYYLAKYFAQFLGDEEGRNVYDKLFEENPPQYLEKGEVPLPSIYIEDFWDKLVH